MAGKRLHKDLGFCHCLEEAVPGEGAAASLGLMAAEGVLIASACPSCSRLRLSATSLEKSLERIEGSAELEGKENCQELVRGRAGSLVEGCLRSRAGRRAHTRALNPFLQAFCSASCSAPDILSSCRSADASSSPYSSDAICVAKFKIVSVFLF